MTLDPLVATERVLRIIGVRVAKKRPSDARLVASPKDALHEASHQMLALVDGCDSADVAVAPHASVSAGKLGRIRWRQDDERADGSMHAPSRFARVSVDVAGFLGESLFSNGADVFGAVHDTAMALARLNIDPAGPAPTLKPLWQIARRVQAVLQMREDGVRAIAKALLARGKLTRAEAAGIAWRADRSPIQFTVPSWLSAAGRQELEAERPRVDAALDALTVWRQEHMDAAYGRSREAAR
jgi:hypothetical protein